MGYSFSRKKFGKIGQYLTQPNPRRTVTYKVVQHVYYIAKHCWMTKCLTKLFEMCCTKSSNSFQYHSTLCKSHTTLYDTCQIRHYVRMFTCTLGCVRKTFFRNFPAIRQIPIPLRPNSWPAKIWPLPIISATKIFWGHNSPKSNDNPVDRWKTPENCFSDTPYCTPWYFQK